MARTSRQRRLGYPGLATVLLFGLAGPAVGAPGDTELISVTSVSSQAAGNSDAFAQSTSGDGRYVLFKSDAASLEIDPAGLVTNLFVRDRLTGHTEPVPIPGQARDAAISADGRFVAYTSWDQKAIYVYDREAGNQELVNVHSGDAPSAHGFYSQLAIGADGRFLAFVGNQTVSSYYRQVFLHDRQTQLTEAISAYDGVFPQADAYMPALTPDGRYVAYVSTMRTRHGDVMLRDRQTGVMELITAPFDASFTLGGSSQPSISADGRFVAFASSLSNLVPGDVWDTWDIFVRDRSTGTTKRLNPGLGGAPANGYSCCTSISADGRLIAFRSEASNLVPDDATGTCDYFVRDQVARTTERVSVASFGAQTNACGTYEPSLSADGRFVTFSSDASNLVDRDFNSSRDVFIHEVGGAAIGTTSFTIKPMAFDFGNQTLFTQSTRSFWLRNTGTVALDIVSSRLRGADQWLFALKSECPPVIPVGKACALRVTFKPVATGQRNAWLEIVLGANLVRRRDIVGSGVQAAFHASPTSLSFGDQGTNTISAGKYVTVTNTGSGTLPIKSIYLSGPNSRQFVRTHNCPAYVPVGGSCTVRVYFKPRSVGAKTATLTVWAGGGAGPKTVALSGTGITPAQ